jgi:hypothetical protein
VSTSRTTETQPLPSSGKAQRYDSDRLGRRATLKSLVAAKRSPILGYNHNVRYRGIVFHIQTEDSGIINPHVFTHLFHGGVIISTRKLVYDPDANDDAVKSLMQAQHKAVMKDLRRGTFDDKIDSYLGGTPGLLPREVAIEAADPGVGPELPPPALAAPAALAPAPVAPVEPVAAAPASVAPVEPVAPPEPEPLVIESWPPPAPADPELAVITSPLPEEPALPVGRAPTLESGPHRVPAVMAALDSVPVLTAPVTDATVPMTILPDLDVDLPRRRSSGSTPPPVRVAFTDLEPGRAPTERAANPPPLPPVEFEAPVTRQDVSEAMRAIQVTDEELTAAGLGEAAEIHSPAPPSAPVPPGLVPPPAEGSTYQLGRKAMAPEVAGPRPPIPRPAARPPIPAPRTVSPQSSGIATPRAPTPTSSAIPTPSRAVPPAPPRATPPPVPPARPAPAARAPTPPASALPRVPTPPAATAPVRGRPTSGGVVVSRPAVIVGGKGAPTAPPTKVRRARESTFGSDLISERSLDEVILAYLSEDTSDE